ncbi:MAG: hypothetical protein CSA70_00925 [Rhodobacterales bacterium]|nr:MAG: hypothetical protein CSA70_00925 [Rhodobacterales bacterium]
MLRRILRKLEREGLINRTDHPTIPPKVEHNLTPMGISFQGPVRTLGQWALENLDRIDAARATYDAALSNEQAGVAPV